MSILGIGAVTGFTASCVNSNVSGSPAASSLAQRDYDLLTGTWQLTRGVVNGRPVPASVLRNTILITDHNTFRFPKASGVGTHPAGSFTVDPNTSPKQVDTIAAGGAHAGQLTRGIYEILDANHKRACWGPPGGPRPTEFESPPESWPHSPILDEDRSGSGLLIVQVAQFALSMLSPSLPREWKSE